jgi:hypothetical protein
MEQELVLTTFFTLALWRKHSRLLCHLILSLQVVNGVVASPFAVTHKVPHTFYAILRAAYGFAPTLMKVLQTEKNTMSRLDSSVSTQPVMQEWITWLHCIPWSQVTRQTSPKALLRV